MELLQAVADWPVAAALRRSSIAYMLLNATHIFSIGVLIGSIVTLDLRILGAFRRFPVAILEPPLSRMAMIGIAAAVLSGAVLFSVRPVAYAQNPAFLAKLALLTLGVINALVLRRSGHWRAAMAGADIRGAAKVSAALSVLIWSGAVLSGRWIGFLQ